MILSANVAHGQIGSMKASMKVGLVVDADVREVTSWGFWLDDKTAILYRQLNYITTESDSLTDLVSQEVPDARIETSGTASTVFFDNLEFPHRTPRIRKAFFSRELFLGAQGGSTAEAEAMLNLSVRNANWLVVQIGQSFGWSTVSKAGFLGGFHAGIGVHAPADTKRFLLTANVWRKFFKDERNRENATDKPLGPDAVSISLNYRFPIHDARLISIGARYYRTHIEFHGKKPAFGLVVLVRSHI